MLDFYLLVGRNAQHVFESSVMKYLHVLLPGTCLQNASYVVRAGSLRRLTTKWMCGVSVLYFINVCMVKRWVAFICELSFLLGNLEAT